MPCNKTALLLSGGMDSVAMAYWLRPSVAFTIDYGQRCAAAEIRAAAYTAHRLGMEHHIIRVDCSSLGSGTLSGRAALAMAPAAEWWPYRNQLLVTLAGMRSIALGIERLLVASVRTDGLQHSDGTPEFYKLLSRLMEYQEGHIRVEMPAHDLDSIQLIQKSGIPANLLLHTHSCHISDTPCMQCSGCKKNYAIRQRFGLG